MFSCEFCKVSKNTFSHRTPPVAASTSSLLKQLLYYLFRLTQKEKLSEAAVHRCSSKQLFLKILQLLLRMYLRWSDFLIKLQAYRPAFLLKKRLQHKCFLKKFLRTSFFVEHLTVHYTFSKFYMMIDFLDVFGYKIDIFHISCVIALISFMVHTYSVLVFTPTFSLSVSFARIATSASARF